MSYLGINALAEDSEFIARTRAGLTEQALGYLAASPAPDPDVLALARAVLVSEPVTLRTGFTYILAASPGFAVAAELPNGGVDASAISDLDMLAATQATWPTVAALYFASDGTPL